MLNYHIFSVININRIYNENMSNLLIAFFVSCFTTVLIIRTKNLHHHLSGDWQLSGPQKFHTNSVPRIGGIGIALGISVPILCNLRSSPWQSFECALLLCAAPAFAIGLTEDLSKRVSVRTRLMITAIGAFLATILLGAQIPRLDIPGVDYLLAYPAPSIMLTIFAITGVSNAYNIIDGFNGLSSMVAVITLLALGYVGIVLGDGLLVSSSFTMVGALLGFFIWNYPRGLIFLGDGGAYLIGFWVATMSVLIVARHHEVSPWFALMINGYPILETVFTIYRRKLHQGKNPGHPDGIHFHSLLFRRVVNRSHISNELEWYGANAKTSPYLWVMSLVAIIPAIFFLDSSIILIGFSILFTISYIWLYKRLVTFKTPKWFKL